MDIDEIREVPVFSHDLDDVVLQNLNTESNKVLAISISKLRQEVRWVSLNMVIAHNLSVQNARFIKKYGPLIMFLWFAGGIILTALVAKYLT